MQSYKKVFGAPLHVGLKIASPDKIMKIGGEEYIEPVTRPPEDVDILAVLDHRDSHFVVTDVLVFVLAPVMGQQRSEMCLIMGTRNLEIQDGDDVDALLRPDRTFNPFFVCINF